MRNKIFLIIVLKMEMHEIDFNIYKHRHRRRIYVYKCCKNNYINKAISVNFKGNIESLESEKDSVNEELEAVAAISGAF